MTTFRDPPDELPGANSCPPSLHPNEPDPSATARFVARNFGPPSVMAFSKGRCLVPRSATEAAARDFIAKYPDADIYFAIAARRDDRLGKLRKTDCTGAQWAWVDLDPPKSMPQPPDLQRWQQDKLAEIERSSLPPPHIIINSGRGLWLFWRLTRLVEPKEAEAINFALEKQLGGDHCHDICRVARVPYTRNSKTGRIASVLREQDGEVEPEALPRLNPRTRDPSKKASVAAPAFTIANPLGSLDDLDEWDVPERVRLIIEHGREPGVTKENDNSRSAWLFDGTCSLARCGVPPETIMAILLDSRFGISASVLDKDHGAKKYATRQVDQAYAAVAKFECDAKGKFKSQSNIRLALAKMGVSLSHDLFRDRPLINGLPGHGPALSDAAVTRLRLRTDEAFHFLPGKEFYADVVTDLARQAAFHPVRDYLDGLAWDKTPRLEHWLHIYGGAEDTPYTRAVGKLILVAAVRRVRKPGCKFDEMLVLESDQGKNKSLALAVLAVREDWFSDDLPLNVNSQKVIECLAGRWIVEASELKGMRKGEVEGLKAFQSRTIDRARPAYGRLVVEVPRQCVIFGTTNSDQYLRDTTGNRRFWPVRVTEFDLDALRSDRDQLWAEAAYIEAQGASVRLDPALWPEAGQEQAARLVVDPFEETLAAFLRENTGRIPASLVWQRLDIRPERRTQEMNVRVGEAMKALGWTRGKMRFGGPRPEWGYWKGDAEQRRHPLGEDWCLDLNKGSDAPLA